jgi:type IV secretory pathway TrbD component
MKNAEESVHNHFRLFSGSLLCILGYMIDTWSKNKFGLLVLVATDHCGLQAMTTKRLHIKQHAVDKHPA